MKFKIKKELKKLESLFIQHYHNYDELPDSWDEDDIVNFRSNASKMLKVALNYFKENNIEYFEQKCAEIDLSNIENMEASVTYLYNQNGIVEALTVGKNLGYFLNDYVFKDLKLTILRKNDMEF